jgi:hypothetical protein
MRWAVCDPSTRMNKKTVRTAESHSSITRGQSVCRTEARLCGSGTRSGMESSEDVLIDFQDCRRHNNTVTLVIGVCGTWPQFLAAETNL